MLDFIDFETYLILMAIVGLLSGVAYGLINNYLKRKRGKNE